MQIQHDEIFKCYKNSTVFNAQNTGNRISKLLDFNFFQGACPQTPLWKRDLKAPLVVTALYHTFSGCIHIHVELILLKPLGQSCFQQSASWFHKGLISQLQHMSQLQQIITNSGCSQTQPKQFKKKRSTLSLFD